MRCCEAWDPVGKCFDPISFECIDFHGLSQIIASLTRENLAEREAQIGNLFLDTDGKRQCLREVQTWTSRLVRQETNAPLPPRRYR